MNHQVIFSSVRSHYRIVRVKARRLTVCFTITNPLPPAKSFSQRPLISIDELQIRESTNVKHDGPKDKSTRRQKGSALTRGLETGSVVAQDPKECNCRVAFWGLEYTCPHGGRGLERAGKIGL